MVYRYTYAYTYTYAYAYTYTYAYAYAYAYMHTCIHAYAGNKTFIVKPSKGCQGTGIRLTRCLDDISPHEPNIVQRYLHKPHLLEGYK